MKNILLLILFISSCNKNISQIEQISFEEKFIGTYRLTSSTLDNVETFNTNDDMEFYAVLEGAHKEFDLLIDNKSILIDRYLVDNPDGTRRIIEATSFPNWKLINDDSVIEIGDYRFIIMDISESKLILSYGNYLNTYSKK